MGSGGHEKKTPSKPTGADDENFCFKIVTTYDLHPPPPL